MNEYVNFKGILFIHPRCESSVALKCSWKFRLGKIAQKAFLSDNKIITKSTLKLCPPEKKEKIQTTALDFRSRWGCNNILKPPQNYHKFFSVKIIFSIHTITTIATWHKCDDLKILKFKIRKLRKERSKKRWKKIKKKISFFC